MPLIDTHIHSIVSFDGKDHRSDLALTAARLGIQTVCFTDHFDVVEHRGGLCPPWDWTQTRQEHRQALALKDCPVELLYGIELGNPQDNPDCTAQALTEPGLDFVIGSIHFSTKKLGREDHYYVKFQSPEHCHLYLDDYFTAMEQMVDRSDFDAVGRIPYPLRYMRERDGVSVGLLGYEERIRLILRKLAQSGKAMEVNSCRSRTIMPEYGWLLRLFKEEGGEFVTVGTDSHCLSHMGLGLTECNALLEANGFRYVTLFRGRKPAPIKL